MSLPQRTPTELHQAERRRHIRGLILLAFAVLLFSILRTGLHNAFPPHWGHPW